MQAVRSFSYRLQCNLTFCNQSEWPACTSITKMKWNNSYIKGVCALQFTKCHLVVKNGDILAFLCWWCSLSGNRKEKQKNLNWFVFFCYIVTFCYPFISRVSFVMLLGGMNLKKGWLRAWLISWFQYVFVWFSHLLEAERRCSFFILSLLIFLNLVSQFHFLLQLALTLAMSVSSSSTCIISSHTRSSSWVKFLSSRVIFAMETMKCR